MLHVKCPPGDRVGISTGTGRGPRSTSFDHPEQPERVVDVVRRSVVALGREAEQDTRVGEVVLLHEDLQRAGAGEFAGASVEARFPTGDFALVVVEETQV